MMTRAMIFGAAALLAAPALADTTHTGALQAEIDRRAVQLQAQDGSGAVTASQVFVTVRHTGGAPVTPEVALAFAEQEACGSGKPIVSLALAASEVEQSFEILCRMGG